MCTLSHWYKIAVPFSHLFWLYFLFVVVPRSNTSVSSRQLRQSSREVRGQVILPEDFDWKAYTAYNPDVFNMGVTSEESAVEYYLDKGAEQGLVHHRLNVLLRYTACTGKLIISRLHKLGQKLIVLNSIILLKLIYSLAPFQVTCNSTLSHLQEHLIFTTSANGIDTEMRRTSLNHSTTAWSRLALAKSSSISQASLKFLARQYCQQIFAVLIQSVRLSLTFWSHVPQDTARMTEAWLIIVQELFSEYPKTIILCFYWLPWCSLPAV